MGWLLLVAFVVIGLPLLPDIIFLVIELIGWIIGRPVRDDDAEGYVVVANAPPSCPSCTSAASDPDTKFCPRCGATLAALTRGAETSRAKAIRRRLSIVGLIVTLIAGGLFAAFKLSGAEREISKYIDPNHPPTISFGTTAPAPSDDDKKVKWEIRLQRK